MSQKIWGYDHIAAWVSDGAPGEKAGEGEVGTR